MLQDRKNRKVVRVLAQPDASMRADASCSEWSDLGESEHVVQFYESDLFLMNSLAAFVAAGLRAGDACIVAATRSHLDELDNRLHSYGLDVLAAKSTGQYVCLDAAETLSKFMVDGSPEPSRFREAVWGAIERAAQGRPRVRVFGELVGILWAEGNHAAAIQLEELWKQLHEAHAFCLYCAYPLSEFAGEELGGPLDEARASHSSAIPAGSDNGLDADEGLRAVFLLKQKARSLEAEIAARKEVERQLRISEIRYQKQLELAGDGILIVDPDSQKIVAANTVMIELLGTLEEIRDKELWEVGLVKDREASLEIFRELNDKGIVRNNDLVIHTKDGQHRDLEFAASLYAADDQRVAQCNVRDVTDRKRTDRIASHLAAIVESSDDAIISKTLEGIILTWNQAAERIFGYSAQEIIGRSVEVLIPPENSDEEPAILEKLKSGERIDHYETVRVAKGGRLVNISLTISPIKDREGRIIAASKIARDITERKRNEDERERLLALEQAARAEAERANRLSDEFLATVSHELRTPLNAILGWSHLLSRGRIDAGTATRAVEAIERNARAQAQLVEDILDVSRVITGKLRLRVGPVDLVSVINAAIDSVQLAADSKGIRFEVTLDPSARRISGDSNRLQQVVWNLLSNAIKFTPPGGRIEIRLEHVYPHVQISVRDNGQGISPDFLPHIFDRFRQADATTTRRHGGLGLGLSIVRHLVELHGGSVHAESSEKEGGATFTLKLPISVSEAHPMVPTKETELSSSNPVADPRTTSIPSLEGLRILLVDDDRDNLQILTVLLTEHKANVQPASSAAEALEVLQWYSPDVLVSDLAMPEEDGYSLIAKVRELETKSGGHIPAVALTAYVRVEDRARALSRGFNIFVPKPVEPSELITAIANLAEAGQIEPVSRKKG